MKIRLLTVCAAIALSLAGNVYAQSKSLEEARIDSLKNSFKVIPFGDKRSDGVDYTSADSVRHLVESFYYDQFRHFQDPAAPYFLFMSRDSQLAMGIGGCVRLRGWYDWGGAINANGFAPYLIDMAPDHLHDKKFGTTPAGTCLFFRVIGRNKKLGEYQLYIEANFNGYKGRDFHLKKAYAMINSWTIGYANSTFSDPSALAPTVDAQGANNKITPTNVLVRKLFTGGKHFMAAVSLETPSTAIDVTGRYAAKCDEWLPDAAAFLQYGWAGDSHLRFSGILRTLSYRNLKQEKNHNVIGWGAMISTISHPIPELTFYGGVNGGRGIASLGGDLQVDNLDLVNSTTVEGEMYAPKSLGFNLGLQYNFTPFVFVSTTYSEQHLFCRHPASSSLFKYGRFICGNIFWNLTARMQIGAEFDLGQRKNLDGTSRWARRIGAMAQFSF